MLNQVSWSTNSISLFTNQRMPLQKPPTNFFSKISTKLGQRFAPALSDEKKPQLINERAWEDVKKSRKLVCGLAWVRVAFAISGVAANIIGNVFLFKELLKPGSFFEKALDILKTSSRMPDGSLYFFLEEIITVPLGICGLIIWGAGAAIPGIIGLGLSYAADYGLKKIEEHYSNKHMDAATEELTHFTTQLAYQMIAALNDDPEKLDVLKFNLASAEQTYLNNGFSKKQTGKILEPLFEIAYGKELEKIKQTLSDWESLIDLTKLDEEITHDHQMLKKLRQELALLRGVDNANEIITKKSQEYNEGRSNLHEKLKFHGALYHFQRGISQTDTPEEIKTKMGQFIQKADQSGWSDHAKALKRLDDVYDSLIVKNENGSKFIPKHFADSVVSKSPGGIFSVPGLLEYALSRSVDKDGQGIANFWFTKDSNYGEGFVLAGKVLPA